MQLARQTDREREKEREREWVHNFMKSKDNNFDDNII